jgi:hypothetical protein
MDNSGKAIKWWNSLKITEKVVLMNEFGLPRMVKSHEVSITVIETMYNTEQFRQAKEFFLDNYFTTISNEERELWFITSDWAKQAVEIMVKYKNN